MLQEKPLDSNTNHFLMLHHSLPTALQIHYTVLISTRLSSNSIPAESNILLLNLASRCPFPRPFPSVPISHALHNPFNRVPSSHCCRRMLSENPLSNDLTFSILAEKLEPCMRPRPAVHLSPHQRRLSIPFSNFKVFIHVDYLPLCAFFTAEFYESEYLGDIIQDNLHPSSWCEVINSLNERFPKQKHKRAEPDLSCFPIESGITVFNVQSHANQSVSDINMLHCITPCRLLPSPILSLSIYLEVLGSAYTSSTSAHLPEQKRLRE